MKLLSHLLSSAALVAGLSAPAAAHQLWLERGDAGLRVHFGEFVDNIREASPGGLDKLGPSAMVASAKKQPLALRKTATHYTVDGRVAADDSIIVDDNRYPAYIDNSSGKPVRSIFHPAARFVPNLSPREPMLDLDIVPAQEPLTFKVFFKGKPVPEAGVKVASVSGWSREYKADADGLVRVQLPWRGPYVFETLHNDKTPGKRGADDYDIAYYVTTLGMTHPTGPDAPPPPPPGKPEM